MQYQLFAVSDEWQAAERRARRAEVERCYRNEEALALVGYVSPVARLRSWVAGLLRLRAETPVARIADGASPTTAGQA